MSRKEGLLKYFTFSLLLFCQLMARGSSYDSLGIITENGKKYIQHRVDEGETLYGLSKRYESDIRELLVLNKLEGYELKLGQVLKFPLKEPKAKPILKVGAKTHQVAPYETLYGIAVKYKIGIEVLMEWNKLQSMDIKIGQLLYISDPFTSTTDSTKVASLKPTTNEGMLEDTHTTTDQPIKETELNKSSTKKTIHEVGAGETVFSIAKKYGIDIDSIRIWNDLRTSLLSLGQQLIVISPPPIATVPAYRKYKKTDYGSKKWEGSVDGQRVFYEAGISGTIADTKRINKYLGLHRTLRIGQSVKVKNPDNNREIQIKIVGKLPESGLNSDKMLRMTNASFRALKISDGKGRVEISYFE